MTLIEYKVVKPTWINGRRAMPGATVRLTERAARYHLLSGALKQPDEPASKPVSKPGKTTMKKSKSGEEV